MFVVANLWILLNSMEIFSAKKKRSTVAVCGAQLVWEYTSFCVNKTHSHARARVREAAIASSTIYEVWCVWYDDVEEVEELYYVLEMCSRCGVKEEIYLFLYSWGGTAAHYMTNEDVYKYIYMHCAEINVPAEYTFKGLYGLPGWCSALESKRKCILYDCTLVKRLSKFLICNFAV